MTIFLTPNAISSSPLSLGDTIGAFYQDSSGNYNSCGSELWTNGALILATFGDDSSTPEIDGLTADEIVTFIATTQSGISYWIYPQENIHYQTNAIHSIESLVYVEIGIQIITLLSPVD